MYRVQIMPTGTLSGIARYYKNPEAGPLEDYEQLCMLNWDPDSPLKEVWVHGLMGKATYRTWRDFVYKLDEMGFLFIRALRKEGHLLPRSQEHMDGRGLVIAISDLKRPAPNSSFSSL